MMRGRLTAVVILAGAAAIVPLSSAFASSPGRSPAVPGSVGIRLVAVAGASPRNPLASSYVVERLAPGTRLTRQVEIDNDTDRSVDVSVYPAAATVVRGSFAFGSGRSSNELSSWTSVGHNVVRLARGSEAFDTLTVNVPSGASSGERYAVLWAEVSAPPTVAGGITLVNRVGVRMYLTIGPGGAPPSNFAIGPLTAKRSATGGSVVVTTVHNSGQGTLDLSGNLMLTHGPDGLRAGPIAATLGTLLAPGASEPVAVQLGSELPRGPWRADLGITSGSLERSAVATITFPRGNGGAKSPRAPGLSTLALVAAALFVVAVMVALALLLSRHRRTVTVTAAAPAAAVWCRRDVAAVAIDRAREIRDWVRGRSSARLAHDCRRKCVMDVVGHGGGQCCRASPRSGGTVLDTHEVLDEAGGHGIGR